MKCSNNAKELFMSVVFCVSLFPFSLFSSDNPSYELHATIGTWEIWYDQRNDLIAISTDSLDEKYKLILFCELAKDGENHPMVMVFNQRGKFSEDTKVSMSGRVFEFEVMSDKRLVLSKFRNEREHRRFAMNFLLAPMLTNVSMAYLEINGDTTFFSMTGFVMASQNLPNRDGNDICGK